VGCGICATHCAHGGLVLKGKKMTVNTKKCVGCCGCISSCPRHALSTDWSQAPKLLEEKIAEYAAAALSDRPNFHVSLLCDISPHCDCHGENDLPILPNIGMLASYDPVAIDTAACDLCNQATRAQGSWLDKCAKDGDVFDDAHPVTHWRNTIDHAMKLGMGTDQYDLVVMK